MVRDYLVQLGSAVLPARLASISKEAAATTQEEGTKSFVFTSWYSHQMRDGNSRGGKVQKHWGWKQGGQTEKLATWTWRYKASALWFPRSRTELQNITESMVILQKFGFLEERGTFVFGEYSEGGSPVCGITRTSHQTSPPSPSQTCQSRCLRWWKISEIRQLPQDTELSSV